MINLSSFQYLKARCHSNQLKSKNWRFLRTNLLCCAAVRKGSAISQFRFQKIRQNEYLYIVCNLVRFHPETSEFMLLTIAPFVVIRQKLAYHKYPECSGPTLIYFTGLVGTLVGIIFQIFVLQSPKRRCYGNQLNTEDVCKRRQGLLLLFASAFDNGLADRKSAFKRFNGNNHATSYLNLVNLRPVILEFTLLKRAIFAAMHPQFDDDLHSSRCRFQMDKKIAIFFQDCNRQSFLYNM